MLGNIYVSLSLTAFFLLPYSTLAFQLILPHLVGITTEAMAAVYLIDNVGAGGDGAGPSGQGLPQNAGAPGGGGAGPGGPAAAPGVEGGADDNREPANSQIFARDNIECFQVPPGGIV